MTHSTINFYEDIGEPIQSFWKKIKFSPQPKKRFFFHNFFYTPGRPSD